MIKLIDHLPYFYDNGPAKDIQGSIEKELLIIRKKLDELIEQCFVDTATTGLNYWESMLDIKTNTALSIKDRRDNIKAKMRLKGTTTIELLKNVASSYTKQEIDIIVNSDDYSFIVEFVVNDVSNACIIELDKIIDEIKPCHLAHLLELTLKNIIEIKTIHKTGYSKIPFTNQYFVNEWWQGARNGYLNSNEFSFFNKSKSSFIKYKECGLWKVREGLENTNFESID